MGTLRVFVGETYLAVWHNHDHDHTNVTYSHCHEHVHRVKDFWRFEQIHRRVGSLSHNTWNHMKENLKMHEIDHRGRRIRHGNW